MSWMCSAIVGVWGEGLRMTELPARRAGIREFIKIRYGYCKGATMAHLSVI